MPRKRTPTEKAEISGQATHNKARFADRKQSKKVSSLGEPSAFLDENEQAAFEGIRKIYPWLKESDRIHVEMTSSLYAQFVSGARAEMSLAAMNQLRLLISAMGGNPSDISKITMDDDESDDPAAKYFQ
ncbi:hypothetical protein [Cohaesibacter gelatinilyticus]|uniref:Phage terminase, small subunit n=1 Tax=Cohaesibacter gelatinilyticus TaxID=372072 RepID=A0A285PIZ9_9HYPH|nr:hypothetical protein [Cohaesibacter gelatinilyticus]SNZ21710.1 hypothetical protein SAMN06265368_4835 [Cohaesibacter gelatinilyticus]